MFWCEKCGSTDACERIDLVNEPVLCDKCYKDELYGECNCDRCNNSYYLGDRIECKADACNPVYDV